MANEVEMSARLYAAKGGASINPQVGILVGGDPQIPAIVQAQGGEEFKPGDPVVLVSSGAIATGFPALGLTSRPKDLATQQASASVGQGLLIASYTQAFAKHGLAVGQILLTAEDVTRRAHYKNAQQTFTRLLELGAVPIVNENDTVATDEIRLGDAEALESIHRALGDQDIASIEVLRKDAFGQAGGFQHGDFQPWIQLEP